MRSIACLLALALAAPGCALRPRYNDLVGPGAQQEQPLPFRLVDSRSGEPLAGIPLRMGEGPQAVRTRTDEDGVFLLPYRQEWLRHGPVLDVTLPAGVRGYKVEPLGAPATAASLPHHADGPALLNGCQVEPTDTGVSVECPDMMGVTAVAEPGEDAFALAEAVMAEFAAGFSESFAGELEREELPVELGGQTRRAIQFRGQLPDSAVQGQVVALDEPARPRAVLCLFVGTTPQPCDALLELLAFDTPAPGTYGR